MKAITAVLILLLSTLLFGVPNSFAGWETGSIMGFDSNVERSVDAGKSDTYLTVYGAATRDPGGEGRLDWSGTAKLEGTAFASLDELNYAMVTLAPGITYFPHALLSVGVSPFVEAKIVNDSDQSALAFGGRLTLGEEIGRDLYAGQCYTYRDSRADAEVYSFTEHVVGAFLGMNWTPSFFTEIGYEFSHGDSFRTVTVTTSSTTSSGRGKHTNRIYSTAFGAEVIREEVDSHSVAVSAGIGWSSSLSSRIGYSLTTIQGDLGTSTSHSGYVDLAYRF